MSVAQPTIFLAIQQQMLAPVVGGSYYCAEDFYCINRVGSWGVGSCTDKRWQDPACPLPLGSSCVPARHALGQVSV